MLPSHITKKLHILLGQHMSDTVDSRSKGWSQGYRLCCNSSKVLAGDPDIIFINYSTNDDNGQEVEDVKQTDKANLQEHLNCSSFSVKV